MGWLAVVALWASAVAADAPHLILISMDTTRADALSCYGLGLEASNLPRVTPTLDALATEGVRFAHFYAHAPTTLNSHTTMMTGLDPHRHGVPANGYPYQGSQPTLAERLKGQGYQTLAVVASSALESKMGLDRGFDIYDDRVSLKHRKTYQDTATGVVRRALQQLGTTRPDRPVFLFVHFYDPHGPLTPPVAFRNRFVASTEYTPLAQQPWTRRAYMERVRSGAVTEADKELGRALYLAEVSYMDHELGRLLQALKERGLLDNAVLILTADHGQNLAENGDLAFSHGFGVHNEVMQVPLIVVGYGVGLPKGRVVQRRLSMSGLAPTLERLLGLQPELGQGMDFYSTLRAGPVWDDEGWPSRPQWPIPMEATRPISKPRPRALRLGNSVLYQQVERWEHERQFTGPQGLEDWMTKWLLAWQAVAPNARSQDMDEQTIEALKALGYLDESSSK